MPGYLGPLSIRPSMGGGSASKTIADILRGISADPSLASWVAGKISPEQAPAGPTYTYPQATPGTFAGPHDAGIGQMVPQEATAAPMSLFQMLMASASGGQSKSSLRAATAPQRAAIAALERSLGQTAAQTAQNQADIGSWFGQLGSMYGHNAKADTRASKKAAKGAAKLGRGLLAGIADPNVQRSVAAKGQRDVNFIQGTGAEQSAFDRHQMADAAREGDYYKMVQARLGAQTEADIRDKIAAAQAARVAARSQAQSGGLDNMLKVLGLVGDNPTLDKILGVGGAAGMDLQHGSALQSALDNVQAFKSEAQGGGPTSDFNGIINRMYAAAKARGLDINDPAVKDAIRNYIQANVVGQYNAQAGTSYGLQNGNFGGG